MRATHGLGIVLMAIGLTAQAQQTGAVSGYLTAEEANGGADGLGLGVKGWLALSREFFLSGELQQAELDRGPFDFDVRQLRLGGGYSTPVNRQVTAFARAEFIDIGADADADGFGLHGGINAMVAPDLGVYGSLGLLELDDDGLELLVGGEYAFSREFSAFVEYRSFDGDELELSDLRAGGTYHFGL